MTNDALVEKLSIFFEDDLDHRHNSAPLSFSEQKKATTNCSPPLDSLLSSSKPLLVFSRVKTRSNSNKDN